MGTVYQDDSGASIREQIGDKFVIIESQINLTQADIPFKPAAKGKPEPGGTLDVYIYADQVNVQGALVNPGKNVNIIANNILFDKDSSIDTSAPGLLKQYDEIMPLIKRI